MSFAVNEPIRLGSETCIQVVPIESIYEEPKRRYNDDSRANAIQAIHRSISAYSKDQANALETATDTKTVINYPAVAALYAGKFNSALQEVEIIIPKVLPRYHGYLASLQVAVVQLAGDTVQSPIIEEQEGKTIAHIKDLLYLTRVLLSSTAGPQGSIDVLTRFEFPQDCFGNPFLRFQTIDTHVGILNNLDAATLRKYERIIGHSDLLLRMARTYRF